MRTHSAFRAAPRAAALLASAGLVLTACARSVPATGAAPAGAPAAAPDDSAPDAENAIATDAPLSIDNRNWSDIVISVVRNDGQKMRIGTVSAATQAVLRLPSNFVAASATIQLVARQIGGWGDFRSERFVVLPGQQVSWTLESGLARSSLAVY